MFEAARLHQVEAMQAALGAICAEYDATKNPETKAKAWRLSNDILALELAEFSEGFDYVERGMGRDH